MQTISSRDLIPIFTRIASLFAEKQEMLCEMDAQMGDGDLGLTMKNGFGSLPAILEELSETGEPSKILMQAGMKMAGVVPSTMGTLMASGLMEGGKQIRGCAELGPQETARFLQGFADGVQKRGKCEAGDRTLYDALLPAAKQAAAAAENGGDLTAVLTAAVQGAETGVAATRDMVPKFGKAAVHAAKAVGVPDQGALAGQIFLEGFRDAVQP